MRTIYEFFEDKETLLAEGIKYNHDKEASAEWVGERPLFRIGSDHPVLWRIHEAPPVVQPEILYDLIRYPKALEKSEKSKADFSKLCMKLFTRGVKEGVIQKDINFEIVTLLAKEQVKMIRPTGAFLNHSVSEVFKTILFTFLRGICTEKGLCNIRQIQHSNNHMIYCEGIIIRF